MPTPKIKDAELRAVLAALETDLNTAFEAAKPGLLAKADDGSKKDVPPSESTDDSVSPPADAGSPAPSLPPAPPAASAGAPPASPSPAGAPPAGMPPAGDPAAEASLTPEALQSEYAQLSPEELDMHLQAAMAAKEALAASAAPAGMPPAGAPPAGPAASPAGMPPPAMKSEAGATGTGGTPSTHEKASGGQEKEVHKSEDGAPQEKGKWKRLAKAQAEQLQTLQKALDEMRTVTAAQGKSHAEDVQNLTKAVTLVLERPERKAITGVSQIEYIKKSEAPVEVKKTFTPAEAKAKLNELIPVLSKSERDLLVRFAVGQAKLEELQPVLDKHLTK